MRLLKIIIISIAFLILICTEAAKLYSFNFSNINIENRCFIVEGNKDLQKVIEPDKTSLDFDSLNIEYRQAMRKWVAKIGQIAKAKKSNFLIIPQNCSLLFTDNGEPDGNLCYDFISVIDGVGQEGINFGNIRYNKATNEINRDKLTSQLNIGTKSGLTVLAVDYCNDENKINITQEYNEENNFIGFQATSIDLLEIPAIIPLNENPYDIRNLSSAQNFLFLLDTEYWNKNYPCPKVKRNIPVPTLQENLILLFNQQEIEELKKLFNMTFYQKYQQISLEEIDYNFIQN